MQAFSLWNLLSSKGRIAAGRNFQPSCPQSSAKSSINCPQSTTLFEMYSPQCLWCKSNQFERQFNINGVVDFDLQKMLKMLWWKDRRLKGQKQASTSRLTFSDLELTQDLVFQAHMLLFFTRRKNAVRIVFWVIWLTKKVFLSHKVF